MTCMRRCWEDSMGAIAEGRRRIIRRILLGLLPFAVGALVWVVLGRVFGVRPVFLPALGDMPAAIWGMFTEQGIGSDIAISCFRVVAGFIAAVLLATPLGVLMGYSPRTSQLFEPIVGFIRYMPVPVFIHLCILWFGSGDLVKVIIIFSAAFFQLTLMVQGATH